MSSDAAELVEDIYNRACEANGSPRPEDRFCRVMADDLIALCDLATAPRWLPIEEAPRDGAEVLTFTPQSRGRTGIICGMHVGFWSSCLREWRQSDLEWGIDPTHYMPLPSPPEGDTK